MLRYLLAIFVLLATVGVLGGIKASQIGTMIEAGESFVPPPESVTTATAESAVWTPRLRAVGSLVARQSVIVSSEVPGSVVKLTFESGEQVKKGQVLVELDSSIERAQLESALATSELAEISLRRTRALGAKKVRTAADLDGAEADAKRAKAAVAQIRAQISKKKIRAPFSGDLGIREVDMGEIVSPGQSLVSLQAVQQLYVDFYLPQGDAPLVRAGQKVQVTSDGVSERVWTGEISAVEAAVDVATRNLRVRATIPNEDRLLRPGMFVEVAVELPAADGKVIAIPETAVMFAPYGDSVYVVEDGHARQVLVRLGERRGDFVAVVSGLSEGVEVVTAGAFKLRDGMAVKVDNERALDASLTPMPEDS